MLASKGLTWQFLLSSEADHVSQNRGAGRHGFGKGFEQAPWFLRLSWPLWEH